MRIPGAADSSEPATLEAFFLALASGDCFLLAGAHFRQTVGQQLFQLLQRCAEAFDAFLQLVVGHSIFSVHLFECRFIHRDLLDLQALGVLRIQLAGQIALCGLKLFQQLWEQW